MRQCDRWQCWQYDIVTDGEYFVALFSLNLDCFCFMLGLLTTQFIYSLLPYLNYIVICHFKEVKTCQYRAYWTNLHMFVTSQFMQIIFSLMLSVFETSVSLILHFHRVKLYKLLIFNFFFIFLSLWGWGGGRWIKRGLGQCPSLQWIPHLQYVMCDVLWMMCDV